MGIVTWILGILAAVAFVVVAILLLIPNPPGLEVLMGALGALLTALAVFTRRMANIVDPPDPPE